MVDLFAGIFLSCPGCVGGKGYVLYAMTPTFQCGGCITLDRLVYKGGGDNADQVTSDIDGHEGLQLGYFRYFSVEYYQAYRLLASFREST
jgi:hypothetical protein